MRKIAAILLILATVLGLASCDRSESHSSETETAARTEEGESRSSETETETEKITEGEQVKHTLEGKSILFIGDSFVYYGKVVLDGSPSRYEDQGYFYQLCKSVGAQVSVTNWTYGGKGISYIYENYMDDMIDYYYDYVVFSGGRNSQSKAEDYFTVLQSYMDLFTRVNPDVEFFYLVSSGAHNISVNESFPVEILNNLKNFEGVADRRCADLSGYQKRYGAQLASSHGLWRYSGESAQIRRSGNAGSAL